VATTKPADQATSPLIVTPVTSDELANMAYSGIYDIAVTLKDGRWEGDRVQLHNGRIADGTIENVTLGCNCGTVCSSELDTDSSSYR